MWVMRAGRLGCALLATLTFATVLIGPGIALAAAQPAPGSVRWTSVHTGDGRAVAADPRGDMVFVAGSTRVAYNAATGAKVWENEGSGRSVAVSPDGRSVFVIRSVRAGGSTWDFSTAAFDAATGRQLWASRYNGRANRNDIPVAVAVSPLGGAVFVTGTSVGRSSGRDYATVAYNAKTGKQLWASRYNGRANNADAPAAIAASPRGSAVFVTGTSVGRRSGLDYATVAYNAATGAPLWTKRYNGRANGPDTASSVAASHDGGRVFVTGASKGRGTGLDYATVGYSTATGTPFWTRRYNGPANGSDTPVAVLVSPRGAGTVIVSGTSPSEGSDYLSVAYTTFNGVTRWVSRFHRDSQPEVLHAAALSPDGGTVYLTGSLATAAGGENPANALTIAMNVSTGGSIWAHVITATLHDAIGRSVAVNPDGGTVYIVVEDFTDVAADFRTVALRA